MDYYAGIDVSLEQSSVCVVDASGKIMSETKVASEPAALSRHFAELGFPVACGRVAILPSGPTHDARIIARRIPAAMLFVKSIGGISHDVREDTP